MPATGQPICHALSVDVEDWYHDGGLVPDGATAERVVANTERLLELLAARGARATFFFLGEVAERYPQLVRRVAAGGHEIGSHGQTHRRLSERLSGEFRADVARSLAVLEDILGARVHGFRAPYFSIKAGVRWPIALLGELGLRYDSSILAIDRPPGLELVSPRAPFRHANGLWEIPVAMLQLMHFWHLPLASGAGLRMVPPRLLRRALARFERDVGAGVFYLHPWELDPDSPTGPGTGRWLLRVGRARLAARLDTLLQERRFVSIREMFPEVAC
jgi:polysaccharide deacetylase family protein (PEP-CTERM system associated)